MSHEKTEMETQVVTPEDGFVSGTRLRSGMTERQKGKAFYGNAARTAFEKKNLRMGKIFVIAVCSIFLLISLFNMKSSPVLSIIILLFTLFVLFHQLSFIRRQARIDHVDVDLTPREVVQETKEFHKDIKTAARASADQVFTKPALDKFRRNARILFGIISGIILVAACFTGRIALVVTLAVALILGWLLFDGFGRLIIRIMGGS